MFGLLTDDEGLGALRGRRVISRRALGDADWGAVFAAGANLTVSIVNGVVQATRGGQSQQQNPAAVQCPAGYYFNATTGQCDWAGSQTSAQGSLFGMDPLTLGVLGVGALLLLTGRG